MIKVLPYSPHTKNSKLEKWRKVEVSHNISRQNIYSCSLTRTYGLQFFSSKICSIFTTLFESWVYSQPSKNPALEQFLSHTKCVATTKKIACNIKKARNSCNVCWIILALKTKAGEKHAHQSNILKSIIVSRNNVFKVSFDHVHFDKARFALFHEHQMQFKKTCAILYKQQ